MRSSSAGTTLLSAFLLAACSDDATVIPPDGTTEDGSEEAGDGDEETEEDGSETADGGDGDGDTGSAGDGDGDGDGDCDGDPESGDDDGDGICNDQDPCFGDNASGDLDEDGICADEDECDQHYADDGTVLCGVIYVDDDAAGANDGTSWADAFTQPVDAVNASTPGDDVWVAAGTYTPPEAEMVDFLFPVDHTRWFGGFAGTEDRLEDRAGLFDQTIINCDFLGDDDPNDPDGTMTDNATRSFKLWDTVELDGFVISHGYTSDWMDGIVGVHSTGTRTRVANLRFRENYGPWGVANLGHAPVDPTGVLSVENIVIENAQCYGLHFWHGHVDAKYVSYEGNSAAMRFSGPEGDGASANLNHFSLQSNGHAAVRIENNNGVRFDNSAIFGINGDGGFLVNEGVELPTGTGVCTNHDTGEVDFTNHLDLDSSTPELENPFVVNEGRLFLKHASTDGVDSACIGAGDMATFARDAEGRSTATDGSAMVGYDAGASWVP